MKIGTVETIGRVVEWRGKTTRLRRIARVASLALALGLSFASLDCGGNSSDRQAHDDFDTVAYLTNTIIGAIDDGSWDRVGAVMSSGTCPDGGSYTVAGSISSGPPYAYNLNFAFNQCTIVDARLSLSFTFVGLVQYIYTGESGSGKANLESSSLTVTGNDNIGPLSGYQSCALDAQITSTESGTLCGRTIVNEAATAGGTTSGSGSTPGTASGSGSGASCPCQATDAPSYAACSKNADEAACSCVAAYVDNCALQNLPGCCMAGASTATCTSQLQSDCQSQLSTAASYASAGSSPECTTATYACQ